MACGQCVALAVPIAPHSTYWNASEYKFQSTIYVLSDEELKEYIQHIYYVLMTRGIRGTYLYVSDPNLRDYISRYVDVE